MEQELSNMTSAQNFGYKKIFLICQLKTNTVGVMKKFRGLQRRIHSDKTTREPPQVRNLTRLLFTAMRHLKEAYSGGDLPMARPELTDYPEYGSGTFAEAADCTQEVTLAPGPRPT